jgi:hypothetical protein
MAGHVKVLMATFESISIEFGIAAHLASVIFELTVYVGTE